MNEGWLVLVAETEKQYKLLFSKVSYAVAIVWSDWSDGDVYISKARMGWGALNLTDMLIIYTRNYCCSLIYVLSIWVCL